MDFNRLRDRGTKKWTAMMLTEHVERLRDWYAEDDYIERPELDEWDLEAMQMEIELAYKRQCEINVTVWKAGKVKPYIGKISELDSKLNVLSVDGPFGNEKIPLQDIVKVQCLD